MNISPFMLKELCRCGELGSGDKPLPLYILDAVGTAVTTCSIVCSCNHCATGPDRGLELRERVEPSEFLCLMRFICRGVPHDRVPMDGASCTVVDVAPENTEAAVEYAMPSAVWNVGRRQGGLFSKSSDVSTEQKDLFETELRSPAERLE